MSQTGRTDIRNSISKSELTVTLFDDEDSVDEGRSHYEPFQSSENHQTNVDRGSDDLISDMQLDETLNVINVQNDPIITEDTDRAYDAYDFNHHILDIQENTNFTKRKSSEKDSPLGPELILSLEDGHISYTFVNGHKDKGVENLRSPTKLFDRFCVKSSNVAIKTEVKSLLRHMTKRLIKEMRSDKNDLLQSSHAQRICCEDIAETFLFSNGERKSVEDKTSDRLLVGSTFYELKDPDPSIQHETPSFCNYCRVKFVRTSSISLNPLTSIDDSLEQSLERNFLDKEAPPSHRTFATSPILIAPRHEELYKKSLNLLNCISRPNDINENIVESVLMRPKLKSSTQSIFHRIFKSRNKSIHLRHTPAYFTTTSSKFENFTSPIEKPINSNKSSPPTSKHNEWLDIEDPMERSTLNEPFELHRTSSCQESVRKYSKSDYKLDLTQKTGNLANYSFPEGNKNSGAVFIID